MQQIGVDWIRLPNLTSHFLGNPPDRRFGQPEFRPAQSKIQLHAELDDVLHAGLIFDDIHRQQDQTREDFNFGVAGLFRGLGTFPNTAR